MGHKVTATMPWRPKKTVDWKKFQSLCEIHATKKEIAHVLDMDEDTLNNRCLEEHGVTFSVVCEKFSSPGKASLRRQLWDIALSEAKDRLPACIWLSKQHLGMKDQPDNHLLENLKPLIIRRPSGETFELGLYSHDKTDNRNIDGIGDRSEGQQYTAECNEPAASEPDPGDRG